MTRGLLALALAVVSSVALGGCVVRARPQPVYYQARPTYYQRGYVRPRTVYVRTRPVYAAPPPVGATVYVRGR